ncbi:MAG: hypothetical protein JXB49_02125 [Bacteroidales bacterium]|nr:hypothetical protein [Bacteroidales bacterium]
MNSRIDNKNILTKKNAHAGNIVYSAFGGLYKGFGLVSFTKLCNGLIGKCLEAPNDTIHEERYNQ